MRLTGIADTACWLRPRVLVAAVVACLCAIMATASPQPVRAEQTPETATESQEQAEAIEHNAALRRWGVEIRGSGTAFNTIYPAEALIDGKSAPGLFGSSPHGLVGAEITIDLPQPAQLHAIQLKQSQRRGRFNRARKIEIRIDDGRPSVIELENLPSTVQRFPLKARGRLIHLRIVSQYDDPETTVGGFDEIELLTHDDLPARFAPPAGFVPSACSLIQPMTESPLDPEITALAAGSRPRTLWTAEDFDRALAAAKAEDSARAAIERHLALAASHLATPVGEFQSNADNAATDAAHMDRSAQALELAIAFRLGAPPSTLNRASAILASYAAPTASSQSAEAISWLRSVELKSAWLIRMSLAYDLMADRLPPRAAAQARQAIKQVADDLAPGMDRARGSQALVIASALTVAGAALDDESLFDAGLRGSEKMPGLMLLIPGSINEDGICTVQPTPPEPLLVEALVAAAESVARRGENLYAHADDRLQKFLLAMLRLARPDGMVPPLGWQGEEPLDHWSDAALEVIRRRFGLNRFAYLSDARLPRSALSGRRLLPWSLPLAAASAESNDSEEPGGTLVSAAAGVGGKQYPIEPDRVCLLPSARVATVGITGLDSTGSNERPSGGKAPLRPVEHWAAMRTGGGNDASPDVLAIDLFLSDTSVLPFGGVRCNDALVRADWYRRSLAHNTLVLDGRSAASSSAVLELQAASGRVGIVRAHSTDAWPGAVVDRTLLLTPRYALDVVSGESRRHRTFDLLYHGNGRPSLSPRTEPQVDALAGGKGYSLMRNLRTVGTSGPYRTSWRSGSGENLRVMTTYAAAPGGEALLVLADPPEVAQPRSIIIDRRRGSAANYATALEVTPSPIVRRVGWLDVSAPLSDSDPAGSTDADSPDSTPVVEADPTGRPGARALSVTTSEGTDYLLLTDRPGLYTAGPLESDARAVWVSTRPAVAPVDDAEDEAVTNGKATTVPQVRDVMLAGGRRLKAFGLEMTVSAPAVICLEFDDRGNMLVHHLAGPAVDLSLKINDDQQSSAILLPLQPQTVVLVMPGGDSWAAKRLGRLSAAREARLQDEIARRLAAEQQFAERSAAAFTQPQSLSPIIIEAENMSRQQGGQVQLTESKVATRGGKAFLGWDEEGHIIDYFFTVPEDGIYQVGLKYATRDERVRRRLEINPNTDDVLTVDAELPNSGGWSNQRDDWLLSVVDDPKIGRPWLVYLPKGRHRLRLTAMNRSLNLDYIVIAPPHVPMDRSEFE